MTEKANVELSAFQDRLFKSLLSAVPIFMALMTTTAVPLSIWLVQNAYMAQATSVLVREIAVELKEQRSTIGDLPPAEWKARIMRLEDAERANVQSHSLILISLEQIKTAIGIKPIPN